tara:strand:+ start:92 stop:358 length:267 start_codon:yes stop_codon:yes gene_type:complete
MTSKTLLQVKEDELFGRKLDLGILNDSCLNLSFSHSFKTHFQELVDILRQEEDREEILSCFIQYFRENVETEEDFIDWLETLKEYSYE